jgi:integrase
VLGRDPIADYDRPTMEKTEQRAWTVEEARTFLQFTADDRLSWAWSLLLTRGLRRGELCGLRWQDIDLKLGILKVNRARVVVDGKVILSTPKTESGRRSLSLDTSLMAMLRKYKARQAAEELAAGESFADDDYLLADELGRPYHPDTISDWFSRRIKAVGLPRIRLHDCRHTAASLMLGSGVPVKVVQEMLGHASPTITLSIYAHVLPSMAQQAGAELSASLLC